MAFRAHGLRARLASMVLTIVAAFVLCPPPAHAQSVTVPARKAAFLLNFARFTEWPPEALPAGHTLVLCVANDPSFAFTLKETIRGRVIDGHGLTVASIALDDQLVSCHLV